MFFSPKHFYAGVMTLSILMLLFGSCTNPKDAEALTGCGEMPSRTGLLTGNRVMIHGTERTYDLSVPARYNPNRTYPVVWVFHGTGGTGNQIRRYSNLENVVPENSAIFVYPDGIPRETGGSTSWASSPGDDRDLVFFDSVMSRLKTEYCINPNRVFATGHSAGGFMSNFLGCFRGDVVTAIAPVAGGGLWWREPCRGHVGVMVIHGTADSSVSFESGLRALDFFLEANGCNETFITTNRPPCERYQGCYREMPVEMCTHHGGHEWPDWAAEVMWGFFMEF